MGVQFMCDKMEKNTISLVFQYEMIEQDLTAINSHIDILWAAP